MAARQEVLNVHLASLLSKLGFPTQAERKSHYAPDVIISHHYLGILLGEAEFGDSWDDKSSREKLRDRTIERFSQHQFDYIDFIVLIIYPRQFIRTILTQSEDKIEEELSKTKIGFGLAYRLDKKEKYVLRWAPSPTNVTEIPSEIEEMAKDVVEVSPEEITKDLIKTIEEAGRIIPSIKELRPVLISKAAGLNIDPSVFESEDDCIVLIVKTMFTLGGVALLVYELVRIRYPLELHELASFNINKLNEGLGRLRRINYVEIIDSAVNAWADLPNDPTLNQLLSALYFQIRKGIDVIRRGGWDVLAFIYQRLLSETYRKAYATFYTKLPAAYLLANLAIESESDKVIDPSCGTGSLLVSAFFVKKRYSLRPSKIEEILSEKSEIPVLDQINRDLLADIYGFDALRIAVSLSSGALTLASLAAPRGRLKLVSTPVGPENAGSLDLLRSAVIPLNGGGVTLKTRTEGHEERVENFFDVVIMNPPFTRSDRVPSLVGDRARHDLNTLKLTFGKVKVDNLFVAGLAKPFLVLGGRLCKEGGRIALVLPNSILSRDAWKDIRKGIANSYAIEYVIVSFAAGAPNFSSDTQFREILLVLRKRKKNSEKIMTQVINIFEAIDALKLHEIDALAYGIKNKKTNIVLPRNQPLVATTKSFNWERVENLVDNWYRLVAFQNLSLTEYHLNFIEKFCVPFKTFFSIGSVVDHTTGFKVFKRRPTGEHFAAVWGSGEKSGNKTLEASPQHFIIVEDKSKVKCKLWEKKYSGNLMILRRGQLDTQYALMFKVGENAVSNVWWPLVSNKKTSEEYIKAAMVYVNSTFGIIHMLGERLETRGLWIEFKKGQLSKIPIPNFNRLDKKQLNDLFRIEKLEEYLNQSLPSIRDYLSKMAELEETRKNISEIIKEALNDPTTKSRAILDKITLELLAMIGCTEIPERLYHLISMELDGLRQIMETGPENHAIRDKGAAAMRGLYEKSQTKLGDF